MLQVFFVLVDLIYLDHLSLCYRPNVTPPILPKSQLLSTGSKSGRSGNTEILLESPLVQSRQAKYIPSKVFNGDNIIYCPVFDRRSVNPV